MNAIGELDKVPSPPTWSTTLLIDAMYFHSAKGCCNVAKMSLKAIGNARKAYENKIQLALRHFNGLGHFMCHTLS